MRIYTTPLHNNRQNISHQIVIARSKLKLFSIFYELSIVKVNARSFSDQRVFARKNRGCAFNIKLKTMARTIRDKLVGIVSSWTFRSICNAKMEGGNNKIRWLIKQVYCFWDRQYLKWKIYQLLENSSGKSLWDSVTNHRRGKLFENFSRFKNGHLKCIQLETHDYYFLRFYAQKYDFWECFHSFL